MTDIAAKPLPAVSRLGALVDIAVWAGALLAITVVNGLVIPDPALPSAHLAVQVALPAQMLALFVVATVLLRRRGEGWRTVGFARPASIRRVAALVVGGYLAIVGLNALLVLTVFPALHLSLPNFRAFGHLQGHPWTYAYWLVLAWLSAALGEELQFRGFLRSRLERLFGGGRVATGAALVLQAAVFGVGHIYQGLAGVLVTSAIGLILGVMFLANRRNLVAGMALHGLIDTLSLTLLFLGFAPPGVGAP